MCTLFCVVHIKTRSPLALSHPPSHSWTLYMYNKTLTPFNLPKAENTHHIIPKVDNEKRRKNALSANAFWLNRQISPSNSLHPVALQHSWKHVSPSDPLNRPTGWRRGSVGRASDSRSKDRRFKSRLRHEEHKKKLWEFFRVKNVVLTHCQCSQPPCVYTRIRMITYTLTHFKDPVVHVRVWWVTETQKDPAFTEK